MSELTDGLPEHWLSISKEILRYLAQNPGARDSSDGIMNWWLRTGEARKRNLDIEAILDAMVRRGWIRETKTGSSPKLYGLNENSTDDLNENLVHDLGTSLPW